MADSENQLSEETGFGVMEHCYSEFTYLSQIRPALYYTENKNGDQAPLL